MRCAYLLCDVHASEHADPGVTTVRIHTQTKGPRRLNVARRWKSHVTGAVPGGADVRGRASPAVVNCIKAVSGSMATF